ncbi:hypothetical protein HPB50_015650 [Hyalomma asiaticum]|uniref:Uncharacterized protein n=1 Tax=Hyalomma asiaticum TaxID=266040 RepID=A0ACB7TI60_HYAAI|nr:hypothetical protein HPB50_015650 [Hyalomma asiaticum]
MTAVKRKSEWICLTLKYESQSAEILALVIEGIEYDFMLSRPDMKLLKINIHWEDTVSVSQVGPPGIRPGAEAAASHTGRGTMADVMRSGRPAAPTQPATSSRPADAVGRLTDRQPVIKPVFRFVYNTACYK